MESRISRTWLVRWWWWCSRGAASPSILLLRSPGTSPNRLHVPGPKDAHLSLKKKTHKRRDFLTLVKVSASNYQPYVSVECIMSWVVSGDGSGSVRSPRSCATEPREYEECSGNPQQRRGRGGAERRWRPWLVGSAATQAVWLVGSAANQVSASATHGAANVRAACSYRCVQVHSGKYGIDPTNNRKHEFKL